MKLIGVTVMLCLGILLAGCVKITGNDGSDVYLYKNGGRLIGEQSLAGQEGKLLKALVKGSIYETGEFVSVFGTCLNVTDGGFIGSYATMSSWYPNGTAFFENVSMVQLDGYEGYFVYNGNMAAVGGTYLTELTCHVNGSDEVAKAFGEWQNPAWVARIANISDQIANLSVNLTPVLDAIANVSMQIGDLNVTMTNSFNQTIETLYSINATINSTFTNLTQQLIYVAGVANASVDRNDSYLAYLLQQLIVSTGTPQTYNLSIVESADAPVYWRNWQITIRVYNEYNVSVGEPLVSCMISTTNTPPTSNELMAYLGNGQFTHSEQVRNHDDFSWTTNCFYN
jgi:hypothetical protein